MTSSFPTFLINSKRFVRLENLVINIRTIFYATFSEIINSSSHTWKIEIKIILRWFYNLGTYDAVLDCCNIVSLVLYLLLVGNFNQYYESIIFAVHSNSWASIFKLAAWHKMQVIDREVLRIWGFCELFFDDLSSILIIILTIFKDLWLKFGQFFWTLFILFITFF